MNKRERREAAIIFAALTQKRCKCRWRFVSIKHDRYRLSPPCNKPCRLRDEVLARLNTG